MPRRRDGIRQGSNITAEESQPEAAADVIVQMAEAAVLSEADFGAVDVAIKNSTMPVRTQRAFKRRVREVYGPLLLGAIKDLARKQFIEAIRARRAQLLNAMTPAKMAEAGVRDIAIAYGTLQDKEALLLGEPTSIVAFERKEKVNELAQMLLQEVERRGLVDLEKQPD